MSILINRFDLRHALHQQNLSPDIADMLTDKIADLLERDKAKKLDYFEIDCGDMSGYCPNCGMEHEGTVGLVNFSFCPDCGQRLDWSND